MRTDSPVVWTIGKKVKTGFLQDYVITQKNETCAIVWADRELVRVPLSVIETVETAPLSGAEKWLLSSL